MYIINYVVGHVRVRPPSINTCRVGHKSFPYRTVRTRRPTVVCVPTTDSLQVVETYAQFVNVVTNWHAIYWCLNLDIGSAKEQLRTVIYRVIILNDATYCIPTMLF